MLMMAERCRLFERSLGRCCSYFELYPVAAKNKRFLSYGRCTCDVREKRRLS